MDATKLMDLKLVHSVHTSERRSFRSCRRRWNWVYRDMWYPRVTPKPLEFGVAYHKAMEKYYDPPMWDQRDVSAQLALVEFDQTIKSQLAEYRRLNGEPEVDVLEDYRERAELGRKMLQYYTTRISPEFDRDLVPVATEIPFEISLDLWCKCIVCVRKWKAHFGQEPDADWKGLPVTFGGRIDAVMKDIHGRVLSLDFKTTARILDEDAEAAFLELDDQVTGYCIALWKYGHPVWGFIYQEQRKAVPEPPEELTRLYKGRKFSTSRASNTDYTMFLETISQHDYDGLIAGMYDDYLSWLKVDGPRYFQRHLVHRSLKQLENSWDDLRNEARDMINDPRVYPQPGRFSCTTCAYRQPCLGMNMEEDHEYTLKTLFEQRSKHYYETEETSTESRSS